MKLDEWLEVVGNLLAQRSMVVQVMNMIAKAPASTAKDSVILACENARQYLTQALVQELQRAQFDFGLIPPRNP